MIFEILPFLMTFPFGLLFTIVGLKCREEKNKNCKLKTIATLVKIEKKGDVYNAIFEYTVFEKKYQNVIFRSELKRDVEKYNEVLLLVNPKDPNEFIEKTMSFDQMLLLIGIRKDMIVMF
jgi:hypothetical protein